MDVGKVVVAASVVPSALLVWFWVRWFRFDSVAKASAFRRSMTVLSLATLSSSVLMIPALACLKWLVGAGQTRASEGISMAMWGIGFIGAILGGFIAASSTDAMRDRLALVALLLTSVWVAMIAIFEPGA